jgi:hypothetical protein
VYIQVRKVENALRTMLIEIHDHRPDLGKEDDEKDVTAF